MNLFDDEIVRRSATRLRVAVIVVMLLVAASLLIAWTGALFGNVRVEVRNPGLKPISPMVSATIVMALAEIALWRLASMLKAIAGGEVFTARVTGHFRAFAFWLMLMAIVDLAIPLMSGLIGPATAGSGLHGLRFVIDLSSVIMLGVTLLLFLLARLLERARGIEEENREIV